jgi:glycosyltransferase involved in cell wall biosynthesis
MTPTCFINGRFLTQESTGVQRYAEELVKMLDGMIGRGDIDSALSFELAAPRGNLRPLAIEHIPIRQVGRFRGHLWEQIELPWHTRHGFLINLGNAAPVLKRNQIVTIYDAGVFAVPATYSFPFRSWYRIMLFLLGKTARHIVTISDFSRRELADRIRIHPSKIRCIFPGREHITEAPGEDAPGDSPSVSSRPYLLAAGSLNPRKNFQTLARAIAFLGAVDFDYIIAGGANPRVFGAHRVDFPDTVQYLGHVGDADLRALYHRATAFIFPSLYEGFGLPPLEAMACGCPVIVSDIPPHREVCGDAALYCDPLDASDMAEKIRLIMSDAALRNRLAEQGQNRAAQFSWQKTADDFYAVLKHLTSAR